MSRFRDKVGVATLAESCFGARDHCPVSFRRVGQSMDLPAKARRWGHDLRGSRQSGWLKLRSRPPRPQRVSLLARIHVARRLGAASRGEDRGRPRRRGGARPRRARALKRQGKLYRSCPDIPGIRSGGAACRSGQLVATVDIKTDINDGTLSRSATRCDSLPGRLRESPPGPARTYGSRGLKSGLLPLSWWPDGSR